MLGTKKLLQLMFSKQFFFLIITIFLFSWMGFWNSDKSFVQMLVFIIIYLFLAFIKHIFISFSRLVRFFHGTLATVEAVNDDSKMKECIGCREYYYQNHYLNREKMLEEFDFGLVLKDGYHLSDYCSSCLRNLRIMYQLDEPKNRPQKHENEKAEK